jgi:hypothetical protein
MPPFESDLRDSPTAAWRHSANSRGGPLRQITAQACADFSRKKKPGRPGFFASNVLHAVQALSSTLIARSALGGNANMAKEKSSNIGLVSWLWRAAIIIGGPPLIRWVAIKSGPIALFPLVGWVILLIWVVDIPGLFFSAITAARHYIAGVEHSGKHEWYGFRGMRLRLFFDDRGQPWIAVQELAHMLGLDPNTAFRTYPPREFKALDSAGGEKCLSQDGFERLLRYSKHSDAEALKVWFERDVLGPSRKRKEIGLHH